jgi:hypothetical protein
MVEWRIYITATRQNTITWLAAILKHCQGRTYKSLWPVWSQHPRIRLGECGKMSRDLRTAGSPHEISRVNSTNRMKVCRLSLYGYYKMWQHKVCNCFFSRRFIRHAFTAALCSSVNLIIDKVYWNLQINSNSPALFCVIPDLLLESSVFNLLVPELFFFSFSTPVYKMWIIQEPNTLELWNKLNFEEEKKTESIYHV